MGAKDKDLCPIRLYHKDYEKIKARAAEYGISFQKVIEILVRAFMSGHKPSLNLVEKYIEENKIAKKNNKFLKIKKRQRS